VTITNGYVTLSELQRALGRTVSTTDTRKDWLEECCERASRLFDAASGGSFFYDKTITSETIDAFSISDNGFYINESLKALHCASNIISISSITESGTALVENTDYYRYKTHIDREGLWTTERKSIVLSGKIGFSNVPGDVKQATTQMAMAFSGLAISSYTDDTGSQIEIIKNNVPKWVWDTVMRYQKVIF